MTSAAEGSAASLAVACRALSVTRWPVGDGATGADGGIEADMKRTDAAHTVVERKRSILLLLLLLPLDKLSSRLYKPAQQINMSFSSPLMWRGAEGRRKKRSSRKGKTETKGV